MKSYKKTFVVKVQLSPGNGYEDCSTPSENTLRSAIRDALAKGLNPSGYIASQVCSIKHFVSVGPVKRKRKGAK